ncbi:hypothetical protein [Vibrio phage vB_VhaS-a]|nr:hypothetical protein [Vibrio phage vB_VhaS-a]
MTTVYVKRGSGVREGAPIIEPLAPTNITLSRRGKRDLDEHYADKLEVTVTVPYQAGLKRRQLVKVSNYEENTSYIGRLINVSHSLQLPDQTTTLTIEALA